MTLRLVLVCLAVGSSTFSVGAFPALLPDLDRVVGLSDLQLGALASAFGFARMVVDVPAGLFVARHLHRALVLTPIVLTVGLLALGSGGPFVVLLGGRILMGVASALGNVAWLTTILRYQSGRALGAALNVCEFTAILCMLGGVTMVGALPKDWSWNVVLLVACAPQLAGIVIAPFLARSLPRAGSADLPVASETTVAVSPRRERRSAIALAFAAAATGAMTYSMLELNAIPLRGSRDFGLDRGGVARLLMLAQTADIIALLPVGLLADRVGAGRLLVGVTSAMALAAVLLNFGGLGAMTVGAVVLGVAMAGWMLPLAVLRRETPPTRIAWRTALYRVGVDGGIFLGPFLAGLLGHRAPLLAAALAGMLVITGALIAVLDRPSYNTR